jgi:DNA-binding NtrC family response regulator
VKLPPLDERRDEIAQWARFMALRRHRESVPDGEIPISAAAEQILCAHAWPGNLRQLDNVVRRAYALALMTHGGSASEVVLTEGHFARALSYERGAARPRLISTLRGAATAFVEEAERLADRGRELDLDLCDAFRGIVLGTAVERQGNRDAAFRLLGKGQQVQSRNHHKMLRRELEKVDALCKALGEEGGSPFAELLKDET